MVGLDINMLNLGCVRDPNPIQHGHCLALVVWKWI